MSVVLVATTKTRIGSMMMMMWTLPRWRTDVLDVFLFVEHEVLSSKSSSSSR
jgi:hypothetical protein